MMLMSPSARNGAGLRSLIAISTNCTVLALATMNASSRRYGACGRMKLFKNQAEMEVTVRR